MGRRKRLRRQAVIEGVEAPFRIGEQKPKPKPITPEEQGEVDRAMKLLMDVKFGRRFT